MGKDSASRLQQKSSLLKSLNSEFTSGISYPGQKNKFQPYVNPLRIVSTNQSLPGVAVPRLPHLKRTWENEEQQEQISQQFTKPRACMVSANGSLPALAVSGLPRSRKSQGIEERMWPYCLPYHFGSGPPVPYTVLKEKLSTHKCGVEATANIVPGSVQKRFLVFDKSGNHTDLFLSSLVAFPTQNLNLGSAASVEACTMQQKESTAKRDPIGHPWPAFYDGSNEIVKTGEGSEMHEDTEEINALLYSDDSNSDDEETSTAHSPVDITVWHNNQEEIEEREDEVTSPIGASKRKRLTDEEGEQSLLKDTASSWEWEDDAESSCVNGRTHGRLYTSKTKKRFKKDSLWDKMSMLQNIIPGGKGKDASLIIDEAIQYLRFLKIKAKSLGVSIE